MTMRLNIGSLEDLPNQRGHCLVVLRVQCIACQTEKTVEVGHDP